jgi:hypothetical protein
MERVGYEGRRTTHVPLDPTRYVIFLQNRQIGCHCLLVASENCRDHAFTEVLAFADQEAVNSLHSPIDSWIVGSLGPKKRPVLF